MERSSGPVRIRGRCFLVIWDTLLPDLLCSYHKASLQQRLTAVAEEPLDLSRRQDLPHSGVPLAQAFPGNIQRHGPLLPGLQVRLSESAQRPPAGGGRPLGPVEVQLGHRAGGPVPRVAYRKRDRHALAVRCRRRTGAGPRPSSASPGRNPCNYSTPAAAPRGPAGTPAGVPPGRAPRTGASPTPLPRLAPDRRRTGWRRNGPPPPPSRRGVPR